MKILLTGASGMLGHALAEVLGARNELLLSDRDDLDITDAEEVMARIRRVRPDVVINAAAYTDVDGAEANEALARRVNGDAVGYLANACAAVGAAFVHFSTDYVFDGRNPQGYREDDVPTAPVNAYGRSKRLGEEKLLRFRHDRLHAYCIRTSWLYGPHGRNFVDTMLALGRERETIRVVNDQHGKPTYTVDLAAAVSELLDGRYAPGLYHMTNATPPEGITWYDFAQEIFRLSGLSVRVIPCASHEYGRPAQRPTYSMLISTKFRPLREWREALEDYLRRYATP